MTFQAGVGGFLKSTAKIVARLHEYFAMDRTVHQRLDAAIEPGSRSRVGGSSAKRPPLSLVVPEQHKAASQIAPTKAQSSNQPTADRLAAKERASGRPAGVASPLSHERRPSDERSSSSAARFKGDAAANRLSLRSARLKRDARDIEQEASDTSIIVVDERVLIRDCFARSLQAKCGNHNVLSFATVEEWVAAAADHARAAVIIVCAQGRRWSRAEIERAIATLSRAEMSAPIVIVSDAEDVDHILEAIKGGARGYIPTSLTLDVAAEAVRLVEAGGTFVPACSLTAPRETPGLQKSVDGASGARFTARQILVVEALHSGLANKQIAHELNMRESTVKVHIRHIMKKLKARNRTEVAVLTSSLFADRDDLRRHSPPPSRDGGFR